MAINYTELFTSLGKLIKHYNAQAVDAQTLPADILEIETVFAAEDKLAAITGLNPGTLDAWLGEHTGRRQTLVSYAEARLTDSELLIELGAPEASLSGALARLIEQMNDEAKTVNASTPAIGAVSAESGNNGNGTVITTLLLDRVNSPGSRQGKTMPAHAEYANLTSELIIAEPIEVRCTADSFVDGASEGGESFDVTGKLPDDTHGVRTFEGSGIVGTVQGIHGNTAAFLSNADFETFTVADTPDDWTIDAGAVTTNIRDGSGANAYHGTLSLNFLGDGATANIQVSQAMPAGGVEAGRRYWVTARIKADATIAAGTLTIQFEGTDYTAGAAEKITIAPGSLPTTWTLFSFNVLMPLEIPVGLKLVIKWTGTPTAAKNVYIDDVGMAAVVYGAGFGIGVVRGSDPFARNDRFAFSLTNTEGVFQKFARRALGIQLPSDSGAAETIADSLAT